VSATLAIALVGAVTGVVGLVWQMASFSLTGARVKVHGRAFLGSDGWRITMTTANHGRLDAYIVRVGIYFGSSYAVPELLGANEKFPVVLKPGEARDLQFRARARTRLDFVPLTELPSNPHELANELANKPLLGKAEAAAKPPTTALVSLGTGRIIEGKITVSRLGRGRRSRGVSAPTPSRVRATSRGR
jgi:hypothetical protein